MPVDLIPLLHPADTRILLVVMDGLGGYASATRGSELEEAATPNLDRLAAEGSTGLLEPVGPGITPGSGPSHLALFGYDPLEFVLGRGALSAAGLDVELKPGDVAARANMATLDAEGRVTDRRAGRPSPEEAAEVIRLLTEKVAVDGVEITFVPEAQHRVLVVLRGDNLDPDVTDTDPQDVGVAPLTATARTPGAEHTAEVVAEIDRQARAALAGHGVQATQAGHGVQATQAGHGVQATQAGHGVQATQAGQARADALLLRGFDSHQELPSMTDRYGLRPAAAAIYPMYRGLARLVGMKVLGPPANIDAEITLLADAWTAHDYFFLHHKGTDSAGEDGDFDAKVAAVEALDAKLPDLIALGPDVLIVTGDHATPSQMAAHSWHPVPVVMWGDRVGRDPVRQFGENACLGGALGRRPTVELMPIALAAADRLAKYGA